MSSPEISSTKYISRDQADAGRYFDNTPELVQSVMRCRDRRLLVDGPLGTGKAQPLDSEVQTPSGPILMADVVVGTRVLTPSGDVATVQGVYPQGIQDVYRFTFSNGAEVEATLDHLWVMGYRDTEGVERWWLGTTEQWILSLAHGGKYGYWLPPLAPSVMALAGPRTHDRRYLVSIVASGRKLCQCIAIDHPDRLYLTNGYVPTHNTRLNLEKLRACCIRYPKMRGLILRSVRKWLTQSALVTWEDKVLEDGLLVSSKINRNNRSEYRFKNGSVVAVAGLDDPQGVFSAEYDVIVLVEAIETTADIVEKVDGRLRNNRMPYQQFLMDTNPGAPTHWLHQKFDAGWCTRFPMRHTDNPALYRSDGTKTRYGAEYLGRLDDLTGVRRMRLRDGSWVQAEGVVYEEWDPAVHVIDPFVIPPHWRRMWSIDFGHTNPLSWGFHAMDPDGRLYRFREIYQTGLLVSDVAQSVKQWMIATGEPNPDVVVTDHDPEGVMQIERVLKGVRCTLADKVDRNGGIQQVKDRLRKAPDGRPRFFVFRNSLVQETVAQVKSTEELRSAGKPFNAASEFETYVWNPRLARNEEPLKENDHACDEIRYLVKHLDKAPEPSGPGENPYGTDSTNARKYGRVR